MTLSEQALKDELKKLPEWSVEEDVLVSGFEFDDFLAAIDFVSVVAELAEERKHHPRIVIEYNYVELSLYTHDADAITQKDIDFAHAVEQLPFLSGEEEHYD